MKGTVKFYNQAKGFGFIEAGEEGNKTDYFFHCSQIPKGLEIKEKDAVTFDLEEGERGPRAIKIKKMEGGKEDDKD